MDYYGPSGSGDGRNPIGCKGFFTKLNVDEKIIAHIKSQMSLLHEYMTSNRGGNQSAQRKSTLADRLKELVYTLCDAFKLSEYVLKSPFKYLLRRIDAFQLLKYA